MAREQRIPQGQMKAGSVELALEGGTALGGCSLLREVMQQIAAGPPLTAA